MIDTIFIRTHEGFHNEIFMLVERKKFMLCVHGKKTHVVTAEEAEKFVKALTSFEVAKVIEKIKLGKNVSPENKVITILMNANFEGPTYTIFRINITTNPINTWDAQVIMEDKTFNLPTGVVNEIMIYLLKNGVTKAPTVGKYDKIIFVDKLPGENEYIDERNVYVLNKTFNGQPADSAWMYDSWKKVWIEFKD